ncbi:hypothetical protein [Neobacillus niacini]|uniref:hypothetical protein n=1 Tax=Neobacillus niacini TaxID=86668 RepID=UPI00285B1D41|nr:hypothetical protein [Neobacillus niacini]MDR7001628.1 hypothetical protein [Neobacillus niacini]
MNLESKNRIIEALKNTVKSQQDRIELYEKKLKDIEKVLESSHYSNALHEISDIILN